MSTDLQEPDSLRLRRVTSDATGPTSALCEPTPPRRVKMVDTPNYIRELNDWGQRVDRLREDPEEFLYALTTELNRLGLEIGIATTCIRTPHPQLDMLVIRWRPLAVAEVPTTTTQSILGQRTIKRADGVQDVYPLMHGHTDEEMWRSSPFHHAIETKAALRIPLEPPPQQEQFPIVNDLVMRRMTDYLVVPLQSADKVTVVLSIATLRPGGFPKEFLQAFDAFLPVLSLSVAYKVERIQFQQVLSAYIGQEPAHRVLQGQIRCGDLVRKHSALGFADLRGFTAASQKLDTHQFLDLISTFFQHVHDSISAEGGEILKFMGDGVLFIVADNGDPRSTCDGAVRAVRSLMLAIRSHNASQPMFPIRFGCGLHYGEVLYGNIGSPARLDFTVMGAAVNLASRLEGMTSKTGEVCLVSDRFAALTSQPTRPIGAFELKGISQPQPIHAPVMADDAVRT